MGKTFEFTDAGIIDQETRQLVVRAANGRVSPDEEDAPRPVAKPAPVAQAKTVSLQPAAPIRPRDVIRLAKARKREIDRDLKRLRSELAALEKEKVQIDALVRAASRPLASVSPITNKRTG